MIKLMSFNCCSAWTLSSIKNKLVCSHLFCFPEVIFWSLHWVRYISSILSAYKSFTGCTDSLGKVSCSVSTVMSVRLTLFSPPTGLLYWGSQWFMLGKQAYWDVMQAVHKVVYIFLCSRVGKEKGQRNESRRFQLENFWQGKKLWYIMKKSTLGDF